MQNPHSPTPKTGATFPWGKIAVAFGLLLCLGYALSHVLTWGLNTVSALNTIGDARLLSGMMITALVLYAMLIAIPFMPGIEVGIALLVLKGAQIAPFVYLATVTGLLTAYLIGRCIPLSWLQRGFSGLRLTRASDMIATIQTTPAADRLDHQRAHLPPWLAKLTVDYRYLTIGALLNVPGTFAIGGGGGILLMAGLSRLFNGWKVLLTLLVATLPVPLTVWLMGASLLG